MSVPLAGFWQRCAAMLLDFAIVAILLVAIALAWGSVSQYRESWNAPYTPITLGCLFCLLFLLRLWLDVKLQGTPGKLLLGCRIIDARSGGSISYRQSLVRGLGLFLAALPAGLGLLRIGWNRNSQGLHDSLSGTLVVLDDESGKSLDRLMREAQ